MVKSYKVLILKHILTWLFVVIPLKLAGKVILLFVLPFVPKDKEVLPKAFRWFDNAEAHTQTNVGDGVDGLMGDIPYRTRNDLLEPMSSFKRFKGRYDWLARRNAINYFQVVKLGKKWTGMFTLNHMSGSANVGDTREAGLYRVQVTTAGEEESSFIWEWYLIWVWPKLKWKGERRCVRLRIGYKLAQLEASLQPGKTAQWVMSLGPFSGYTGE